MDNSKLTKVDKLTKYNEEDEECCCCFEEDNLWKTSCNHIVCKKCLTRLEHKICPICRKNIFNECVNTPGVVSFTLELSQAEVNINMMRIMGGRAQLHF